MIELPVCTSKGAAAASILARHFPVVLDVGGETFSAVLDTRARAGEDAATRRLIARLRNHTIRLVVDEDVLPPLARSHWPEIAALPQGDPLREILFDVVLQDVSVAVEGWCGERPVWLEDDDRVRPHRVLLRRDGREEQEAARAELDDEAFEWLSRICQLLPAHTLDIDGLLLRLRLVACRFELAANELDALSLGDTVLADDLFVAPDGSIEVVVQIEGRATFRGTIEHGRLSLISRLDDWMEQPDGLPPPSLDALDLPVEVHAGQLLLPLARIKELSEGQILDLGSDVTTNVSLVVNGQVIATGELVRIGERTGVRILEIRLARSSA